MDEFFESLVDALRTPDREPDGARHTEVSKKHGQQRGSFSDYTLDQVLAEFIALRRVIFQVLRQTGSLDDREIDVIFEFIQEGMRQAGAEFAAVQEQERDRALITKHEYTQEAEAKLAADKHEFEAIFVKAPAAIVLFKGPKFIIEKANPGFFRMFNGRDLIGKTMQDALPELVDQPFHQLLSKVYETGDSFIGREELVRLARREGAEMEERYFDFIYTRIDDAGGKPYGVYEHAIEVTERVHNRNNLEESKQRLQVVVQRLEKERELREGFVAALSHDLRNPLAAARSGAELLNRTLNDEATRQKLSAIIRQNIDRADHMIRDLLDANRIHAGQTVPLKIDYCELTPLVRNTLDEIGAQHPNRFVMGPTQPITGFWDCSALRRIVENLAGNAVKYGHQGTTVTVQLSRESESHIAISIHNEGNAISAEDQVSMFQAFQRSESAQQGEQKGWGIGLTLVQGFAEAHGGRVEVESAPERGTTFRVHLPIDARPFQK